MLEKRFLVKYLSSFDQHRKIAVADCPFKLSLSTADNFAGVGFGK